MSNFVNMLKDEAGASAAEYALILAIVGTGIAAGAAFLGGQISRALNGAGDKVCAAPSGGTTICRAAS
jgi:pilus assembly protein Flp/PilA